ncbi:hypothetical protein ACFXDI_53940, partial [Streptomyces mirabilis]
DHDVNDPDGSEARGHNGVRTKVTWGAGSTAAALAMVIKLVESARERWRAVSAPRLLALVRAESVSNADTLWNEPSRTSHERGRLCLFVPHDFVKQPR